MYNTEHFWYIKAEFRNLMLISFAVIVLWEFQVVKFQLEKEVQNGI